MRCRCWVLSLLILLVGFAMAAGPSGAEEKPVLRTGTLPRESPHATLAERFAREDFQLDGRLTEAAWAGADSIANLITVEPVEGGVPAGKTVLKVLANPREVVIGVVCMDADPEGIVSFSKARDSELDEEDHVLIVLDTFGDSRSGYVFAVNPSGCRFDGLITSHGDDVNRNWDAVWEAATTIDSSGWSAEIRLPIQSLSFARGLTQWGFNVERRVQRLQETSRWSGARRDFEIFQTSRAGVLSGLPRFDLGLGLMLRPGVVAGAARPGPGTGRELSSNLSLDANQKLGPNLSATLTVNTDFGETEADVRQTNLSRFDVLFPERRSFFLEGADIFEFGLGLDVEDASLLPFFSRRIGLVVPEGEDEVHGREVPLRAGAKLQGRVGETNVGGLVVATDKLGELGVPEATMGAVRVRQNVFSASSVGMIATFGDPLNRGDSWLAGGDFTFRTSHFQEDKNLLAGVWGLTTSREELEGDKHAFGGKIAYPNDLVNLGLTYFRVGDGFQPSLGFVQRTGQILQAVAGYNPRPDWSLVRQVSYGLSYSAVLDLGGKWESYSATITPLDWLFESGDRFQGTVEPKGERPAEGFDVFESPSGPIEIPAGTYRWTTYTLLAALAEKRAISGEVSWSFGGFYEGDLRTIEAAMALKPHSIVRFQLGAERNRTALPQGGFTQYLWSARTELKVSPELQVTHLLQYDNESRSLGSAARLRWTFHPVGDLFIAFNSNMLRSTGNTSKWTFESDQLLMKVQYALRF